MNRTYAFKLLKSSKKHYLFHIFFVIQGFINPSESLRLRFKGIMNKEYCVVNIISSNPNLLCRT